MKNRKIVTLSFAFLLLLATIAYARPITDVFAGGLGGINNFFAGEAYRPYAKAIDFFFFALLFIAIYMMGARYAFKEVKRPEQVIVILLGLMTAFLLVLGGWSAVMLIPYLHWFFYVLLFLLYWWLLRFVTNPVLRFLVALLLTLVTIALLQGLYTYLVPEGPLGLDGGALPSFSFGGYFGDLFGGFKGVKIPNVDFHPGIPSYAIDWFKRGESGSTTIINPPTPVTDQCPNIDGMQATVPDGQYKDANGNCVPEPPINVERRSPWNWLWLLLPLLLLLLLPWLYRRTRERDPNREPWWRRRTGEKPAPISAADTTLKEIMEDIEAIIKLKKGILDKIRAILEIKRKASLAFWELYHKKISHPAFLMDPDSSEHTNLMSENDKVTELLRFELSLEDELVKLRQVEERLTDEHFAPRYAQVWKETDKKSFLDRVFKLNRKKWDAQGDNVIEPVQQTGEYIKDEKGKVKLFKNKPLLLEWAQRISEVYQKTIAVEAAPYYYMDEISKAYGCLIMLYGPKFLQHFTTEDIIFRMMADPKFDYKQKSGIGLVNEAKMALTAYFLLAKSAEESERKLKQLIDLKSMEGWVFGEGKYEKWLKLREYEAARLKKYFEEEERPFLENIHKLDDQGNLQFDESEKAEIIFVSEGKLKPLVNKQMRYLQLLYEIMKFLDNELSAQRRSFTKLQELNVAVRDQTDKTKWHDIDPTRTEEIYTETFNIPHPANTDTTTLPPIEIKKEKQNVRFYDIPSQPIKIFTNFAEGIAPFTIFCYVDGTRVATQIAERRVPQNPEDEPMVRFYTSLGEYPASGNNQYEIGVLAPGSHKIHVVAMSPGAKYRTEMRDGKLRYIWDNSGTYYRVSEKTIFVNVMEPAVEEEITEKKILRLKPVNSHREDGSKDPIELIGEYHLFVDDVHVLKIGKEQDNRNINNIHLVDTNRVINQQNPNETQFKIIFTTQGNMFTIVGNPRLVPSGLSINNNPKYQDQIKSGDTLQLNEYTFEVEVFDSIRPIPTFTDYLARFPVRLFLDDQGIHGMPHGTDIHGMPHGMDIHGMDVHGLPHGAEDIHGAGLHGLEGMHGMPHGDYGIHGGPPADIHGSKLTPHGGTGIHGTDLHGSQLHGGGQMEREHAMAEPHRDEKKESKRLGDIHGMLSEIDIMLNDLNGNPKK